MHVEKIHVEAKILGGVGNVLRPSNAANIPCRAIEGVLQWSDASSYVGDRSFGFGNVGQENESEDPELCQSLEENRVV